MKEKKEDHEITEREKRAYQRTKKRAIPSARPKLTHEQQLEFLDLIAKLASPVVFKRRLNLSTIDIQFYKRELNVESQEEARLLRKRMERGATAKREAEVMKNIKDQRAAEAVAQKRLEELEQKRAERAATSKTERRDMLQIRLEDAARKQRFNKQQAAVPASAWRLPLERHRSEAEQIEQFRRDLQYRGVSFCRDRYGVKLSDLKSEASRLGIKINWDNLKR